MMIPEMAGRQLFCVVPLCEHVGAMCSVESHYTCLRLKVLTSKKSFVKLAKISWRRSVKQSFLSLGWVKLNVEWKLPQVTSDS